jgi:hypothetical protein
LKIDSSIITPPIPAGLVEVCSPYVVPMSLGSTSSVQ